MQTSLKSYRGTVKLIIRKVINKDKDNDTQLEKEDSSNKAVITGDFMLNNINSHGLSKTKKFNGLNFPEATSTDIVTTIDDVLDKKLESIIIHVGNDLTNDANLLTNVKKISSKINRFSFNTELSFLNRR